MIYAHIYIIWGLVMPCHASIKLLYSQFEQSLPLVGSSGALAAHRPASGSSMDALGRGQIWSKTMVKNPMAIEYPLVM